MDKCVKVKLNNKIENIASSGRNFIWFSDQLRLLYLLKCPYHQNCYFPIWSHISCNELLRKNFRFGWKANFLWVFKNLKILFSHGRPVPLITASTCSELWRRFRNVWIQAWLISLVLPPCKFSFVVHAKSSFPAFCMNYWVKFTELKQAR